MASSHRWKKCILTVKNFPAQRSCSEFFPFLYTGRKGSHAVSLKWKKRRRGCSCCFYLGIWLDRRPIFFFFPLTNYKHGSVGSVGCLHQNVFWTHSTSTRHEGVSHSCMHSDLKHCRGKHALYFNHLLLKCLFGWEPAQEMRWQDTEIFFFFFTWIAFGDGCASPTSVCQAALLSHGASAVTWRLIQLQRRRCCCFSSNPLESNKVQRTRRQARPQQLVTQASQLSRWEKKKSSSNPAASFFKPPIYVLMYWKSGTVFKCWRVVKKIIT